MADQGAEGLLSPYLREKRIQATIPYIEQADPLSKSIITTPPPPVAWVHHSGATVRLYFSHANEEHESLLNYAILKRVCTYGKFILNLYWRLVLAQIKMLFLVNVNDEN